MDAQKVFWQTYKNVQTGGVYEAIQFAPPQKFYPEKPARYSLKQRLQWDGRMFDTWKVYRDIDLDKDFLLLDTISGVKMVFVNDWIVRDNSGRAVGIYEDYLFEAAMQKEIFRSSHDKLKQASQDLVKFLQDNYHPHITAIVTSDSVEIVEELMSIAKLDQRD